MTKTKNKYDIAKILLIILLAVILAHGLNEDILPMPFGIGMAVVLSNSMEPALAVDDLVIIYKTQDITPGDIIVYQSGYSLIIHRVMEIDGQTVTTKGDANNTSDPPFDITNVKGKLIIRIPHIGGIITTLKQ